MLYTINKHVKNKIRQKKKLYLTMKAFLLVNSFVSSIRGWSAVLLNIFPKNLKERFIINIHLSWPEILIKQN